MSNADRLLNKYNPNRDEKGRFAAGDGGGGGKAPAGGAAKQPKAERDTGGRGIIEGPHKEIKLRHKDEVDALQVEQGKRYDALRAKGASPAEWEEHRKKMAAENDGIYGRHQKELRAARKQDKPAEQPSAEFLAGRNRLVQAAQGKKPKKRGDGVLYD